MEERKGDRIIQVEQHQTGGSNIRKYSAWKSHTEPKHVLVPSCHRICYIGAVCAPEHTNWATEIKIACFIEGLGNEQLPGFCLLWACAFASFSLSQSGIAALCRTIKWYHNRKTVAEKLLRLLLFWKHLGFWSSKPSSPELEGTSLWLLLPHTDPELVQTDYAGFMLCM